MLGEICLEAKIMSEQPIVSDCFIKIFILNVLKNTGDEKVVFCLLSWLLRLDNIDY